MSRIPVDPESVKLLDAANVVMSESDGKLDFGQALREARHRRSEQVMFDEQQQGRPNLQGPVDPNSVKLHQLTLQAMRDDSTLDYGQALRKARDMMFQSTA